MTTDGSIKSRIIIAKVLFAYCNTPYCIIGTHQRSFSSEDNSPQGFKPNTAAQIEGKQLHQKISHDNSVQLKQLGNGQSVLVHVYSQQYKWTRGTILRSTSPVSYIGYLMVSFGDINLKAV